MSPPHVIVGKDNVAEACTGFKEVETTCDIGFNGTYLTWAWSAIVVTNSAAITTILLKKDGIFIFKTSLVTYLNIDTLGKSVL